MVYRGKVKNGVVVLEPPSVLPEGAEVRVEIVPAESEGPLLDEQGQTLGQKLMKYAGRAVGLPEDAAVAHDTPIQIPEGTEVLVEPLPPPAGKTLAERLGDLIGSMPELPPNMAERHDHYLHGAPKR